jgi:Tfp pilus assembly PilM family ATPase
MSAHPPAGELLQSVSHFLRDALLPSLDGAQAFNLRISINAIDLVRREIAMQDAASERERARLACLLGGGASLEAMRQTLCEKIAFGAMTLDQPGLRQHLRATAIDRLAIDQPSYSAYLAAMPGNPADDGSNNEAPRS